MLCTFARRYNGEYVQTKGLVEQIMADKIIGFLKQREQDRQPFLQYYAPYAIHATRVLARQLVTRSLSKRLDGLGVAAAAASSEGRQKAVFPFAALKLPEAPAATAAAAAAAAAAATAAAAPAAAAKGLHPSLRQHQLMKLLLLLLCTLFSLRQLPVQPFQAEPARL
jgi:hypothetical protein